MIKLVKTTGVTAALLLAMSACGSSDSSSDGAGSGASDNSASADSFCNDFKQLDSDVDSLDINPSEDLSKLSDKVGDVSSKLSDISPPDEIKEQWGNVQDFYGRMADTLKDIDLSNPGEAAKQLGDFLGEKGQEGRDKAESGLKDVQEYVTGNCN